MTIPASDIARVIPGVLGSGGNPLALNGVLLSKSRYIAVGDVLSFGSADAIRDYFGPASAEYRLSQIYFAGYENATQVPGSLLLAPYVDTARAAWLQSGSFAGVTLTQLQALSGVLTISVDGVAKTSSSINLSTAASFSDAATKIAAAFTGGPTVTWNAVKSVFIYTSGTTGGASTITFGTGTISEALKAAAATGAFVSQGAAVDTPATAMRAVKARTQNWATFATMWEPDTADKTAFAAWVNAQGQRYTYVAWDTDAQAAVNGSTTCFGVLAKVAEYDGVVVVYNTADLALFVLGCVAAIDFGRTNARATLAFKSQSGFSATVTDAQTAANLKANGYNFYGAYATANDQFTFFYPGQMPGKWKWIDTYANQIRLHSQFQLALISLLTNSPSIPYNEAGYTLFRAALRDPIDEAFNFGSIRAGVDIGNAQAAIINQEAGRQIATEVEQQGFYLQILDPGAQVRGQRGSPIVNFWFTDGGSVHSVNVASVDIL